MTGSTQMPNATKLDIGNAICIFILGSLAVVAAGIVAYAIRNGDVLLVSSRYEVAYLGLPSLVLTISLFALIVRRARTYAVLILVPAVATLWIGEGWFAYQEVATNNAIKRMDAAAASARIANRPVDDRPQANVIDDLRNRGIDAFPTFSPTTFLLKASPDSSGEWQPPMRDGKQAILPLTGVSNISSVYCNESGQWLVYVADRYGFNNPDAVWNSNEHNVVVLGDSFAQGACVPSGRSAVDVLRSDDHGTVSLGVGGTGPLLQLGVLKEYGPLARPKTVFWFFYEGNDLHTNLRIESQFAYLRRYLSSDFHQGLPERRASIDRFLRSYVNQHMRDVSIRDAVKSKSELSFVQRLKLTGLRDRFGLTSCPQRNQDFALLRSIYAEAKRTVQGWGGNLVVVYLPAWDAKCDLFDPASSGVTWLRREVLEAVSDTGLDVIDLASIIQNDPEPSRFFYYKGSHYNEDGYLLLSREIQAYLARQSVR